MLVDIRIYAPSSLVALGGESHGQWQACAKGEIAGSVGIPPGNVGRQKKMR